MAVTSVSSREAVTRYRLLELLKSYDFIEVSLETGRTHQIRVHFAHRRHALVGDPVYGGRLALPKGASDELIATLRSFRRQALHAAKLGFTHPESGEEMEFEAPLPEDFRGLLQALRDGVA